MQTLPPKNSTLKNEPALVWSGRVLNLPSEPFTIFPSDGDRPVVEVCFETAHPDWLLLTQKLLDVALCYGPVALGVDRNRDPERWAIAVVPETYDIQSLAAEITEDGWLLSGHTLYSPETGTALNYDDLIDDLLSRPVPKTLIAEVEALEVG